MGAWMGGWTCRSFVGSWQATMKIHEVMADNRIRFAQRLNEMSEELANLAKEVDKNRKSVRPLHPFSISLFPPSLAPTLSYSAQLLHLQTKELATRYERSLQESELLTEKSKARFDVSIEELERILLQKEGESPKDNIQGRSPGGKRAIGKAAAKGALLLKGKNPGNVRIDHFIVGRDTDLIMCVMCHSCRDRRTSAGSACRRRRTFISARCRRRRS